MAKLLSATSKNGVQKTLAAELLSTASTGDAITFADVDGIPNLPGVLVIDRIDSAGTATPAKREYIEYSGTSGTTVLITTRNVDGSGSAQTHAVGAIVEFVPDVVWADRIYDALSNIVDVNNVSALASGITLSSPTLLSPNIPLSTGWFNSSGATITTIKDEDDMASNSATALSTQQSTKAYVDNQTWLNGWNLVTETWTRTGNHTFTVAGDLTAKYRKGTKVRYKDGGAYEYGTVISSSYSSPNTTVTLATNTDYVMAEATITDTYISYIENPEGYPQRFTFNVTLSAETNAPNLGTTGTFTGVFEIHGKTVIWQATAQTGGTGISAGSGLYVMNLPIAQSSSPGFPIVGYGWLYTGSAFKLFIQDSTRWILTSNGAGVGSSNSGISGAGEVISVGGVYQIA